MFVRTKHRADRLVQTLTARGHRCAPLHANRSQHQRLAAVQGFKAGHVRVLVATDIAARGLDVEGIRHVINFEPRRRWTPTCIASGAPVGPRPPGRR